MSRNLRFLKNLSPKKIIAISNILLLVLVMVLRVFVADAQAAALTEAAIRLDRMGAGVAANTTTAKILVVAKTATVGTETTVKIGWPTTNAFTVNATAGNHTISTASLPATYQGETLVAWPGIATATLVATGDVTFPSTDLTVGTLYGFYITGGITNPATGDAGTKLVSITAQAAGPATIDSQTVAVDTVTTNADQVVVTATVASTFNFALSANAIALGTLSTSARSTGNVTVDIDTNANNGWIAYIRSEGTVATLASALTLDAISSTDTSACVNVPLTGTVEGYVVDVNAAAGTNPSGVLTVATEYNCTDSTDGGVIATTYEQIAERTGSVDSDTLTLNAIVKASTTNKAATDYTDTWEVVGAGNF